jgi:glycosyltransferase involved in cell wall biosynthesis
MKVLLLHSSSDLYGAGKILLVVTEILQQAGHTPIVVVSGPGPLVDALQAKGISVHLIPLGILRRKYANPSGIRNRIQTLRKAYLSLKQLIQQEKIDLLYSNTTAVLVGAWLQRSLQIRHIWHIHEILPQAWLSRFLGYWIQRSSDAVIVVSDAVAKHWQKYIQPKKIHRIYNGIDYTPYTTDPKDQKLRNKLLPEGKTLLVGMIGRVHHWKGQDYFLEIAHHLLQQNQHIQFVMVGDAFPGNEYLYDRLAALRKQYQLGNQVTDLGYRTDIPEILQALDLFILPSTAPDPFPTVLLEAMASGKPVAATAHGGATEMIEPNQSGVLIPWNDAAAAATMLMPLIADASKRASMAQAARNRVIKTFSKEAFRIALLKTLS